MIAVVPVRTGGDVRHRVQEGWRLQAYVSDGNAVQVPLVYAFE